MELTHDIIKEKWKPIILWWLGQGPHSLADLEREIKGVSQKILVGQLRELCDYGMMSKTSYEGYPLKVEHALTSGGIKMLEAVAIVQGIEIEMMTKDGREEFLHKKRLLG